MPGGVDRLANLRNRRQASGRGLVVQHANCFDLLVPVLAKRVLDRRGVVADAAVCLDELRVQSGFFRHGLPQRGKLPGFHHQHAVAGRERVDERGFPCAGASGGIDDDRIGGLEDGLDAFETVFGELGEFRPAVVDDRRVHGPQHAVGQRRRPRNVKEVAAHGAGRILRHRSILCRRGFFGATDAEPQLAALKGECESQSSLLRRGGGSAAEAKWQGPNYPAGGSRARSLRYGNTRENVLSIDAVLADGALAHFGPVAPDLSDLAPASPLLPLACDLLVLASSEADEIETRFPKVQRRVGGYNLDSLLPGRNELNLAHILVGSE